MRQEKTKMDRAKIMNDIEAEHLGRCIDQLWGEGRRTLVELMDFPRAQCQVVVVKQFESAVPKSDSGKPWPALIGAYVYVPIDDPTNTWAGLDEALAVYARTRQEDAADKAAGVA